MTSGNFAAAIRPNDQAHDGLTLVLRKPAYIIVVVVADSDDVFRRIHGRFLVGIPAVLFFILVYCRDNWELFRRHLA